MDLLHLLDLGFNHSLIGLLLLIFGVVYKFFPPKNINVFYGFRTERSEKSKEVWDKSNIYCAKKIIEVGIFLTILGAINLIVLPKMYSLFSIIAAGPLLIWVIVKTDKFISQNKHPLN